MSTVKVRLAAAVARRLPHPEPPSAAHLARLRVEPAWPRLARVLLGPVPRSVRLTDRTIPAPAAGSAVTELRARVYQPEGRREERLPLVINFHGGGFVFGNLAQTDWLCAQVAQRVVAVVVSVGYRLAPEHPAPIPFQDCRGATGWLIEHAAVFGADAGQVSVMGASAGGNLAALVALHHRDQCRDDPTLTPLRHQILIYPATDLGLASPSVAELGHAPILTRSIMDWYGRRYLPQDLPTSVAFDDPWVSPLFATDHSELAPALIIAAGQDPLRDDAIRYGAALADADVPNQVILYPDAIHGFISMPRIDAAARPALDEIVSTLSQC